MSPLLTAPTIRALESRFQRMFPTVKMWSPDDRAMRAALERRGWELIDAHPLGAWIPRIVKVRGRTTGRPVATVTYRGQTAAFALYWGAVDFKAWVNKLGGFRLGSDGRAGGVGRDIVDWIIAGYPHRAIEQLPRSRRLREAESNG